MPLLAHAAPGFFSKWIDPKIPLWASLLSCFILDILSIIFFIFGQTISIIMTHSLVMAVVWSLIALLFTTLITSYNDFKNESKILVKNNVRTGLFIGLLVFSHWVGDLIGWPMTAIDPTAAGVPILFDLTQNIGLGVYTTWVGALFMEFGMLALGLAGYFYYKKKEE